MPYHRLHDKNQISDERIASCPLLAVGQRCSKIGKDPDDVMCAFIDKYITAVIPPVTSENEHQMKLMDNLQKHTHSDYCCKNKSCHFGFPKPPATKTLISGPPLDDNDHMVERQNQYYGLYKTHLQQQIYKTNLHKNSYKTSTYILTHTWKHCRFHTEDQISFWNEIHKMCS